MFWCFEVYECPGVLMCTNIHVLECKYALVYLSVQVYRYYNVLCVAVLSVH